MSNLSFLHRPTSGFPNLSVVSSANLIPWRETIVTVFSVKPKKSLSLTLRGANSPKPTARDLARKVRWVAAEDGDRAGYDVLSFDSAGRQRLLEVKTTNGPARTPFFLTRYERDLATERPEDWRIYRVHLFATEPRIFTIAPPLEDKVNLWPDTWRASF